MSDDIYIDPTRGQFDLFKGLDRDQPVEMLNLVRFRDKAAYPRTQPLHAVGLTEAEAYRNYSRDSEPVFRKVGGSIIWRGAFQATLIGPEDETWDSAFIARYPTAHAFLAMVTDADYRLAVVHRQAAVLTSRLIRMAPSEPGTLFG